MNAYQSDYQEALLTVDQLEKLLSTVTPLDDSDPHTAEIVALLEIHFELPAARRALRQAEAALIAWGHTFINSADRDTHDLDTLFRSKSHYRGRLAQILLRM